MKKSMFYLGSLLLITISSCKKDFTCTCTYTQLGVSQTAPLEYKKVKEKDAEENCNATEETYKKIDPQAKCSLK